MNHFSNLLIILWSCLLCTCSDFVFFSDKPDELPWKNISTNDVFGKWILSQVQNDWVSSPMGGPQTEGSNSYPIKDSYLILDFASDTVEQWLIYDSSSIHLKARYIIQNNYYQIINSDTLFNTEIAFYGDSLNVNRYEKANWNNGYLSRIIKKQDTLAIVHSYTQAYSGSNTYYYKFVKYSSMLPSAIFSR